MKRAAALPIAMLLSLMMPIPLLLTYAPLRQGEPPASPATFMFAEHDTNEVLLGLMSSGQAGRNLITWEDAGIWPRDSGNSYIWGSGLWIAGVADIDGDGESDTSGLETFDVFSSASEFAPGRVSDDPEDPLARLFVSTNPLDLAEWPMEFRDAEGNPEVLSLQDIVGIYNSVNGTPCFGINAGIEIRQRSMAFGTRRARQAVIFVWDMTNVSEYSEAGPYTLEDVYVGMNTDLDIGADFADDRTSRFTYLVPDQGDSIPLHMMFAWDDDFHENDFQGTPGFIGFKFLQTPGNDADGIDNDGDGLVDESPENGIDDDGDGRIDEPDELDQLGLVHYSFHCPPSSCQLRASPMSDPELYRLMACEPPEECVETTEAQDIRAMMSSGPFDWPPGKTIRVAVAYLFADAVGHQHHVEVSGDPPRPDPNDPIFADFVAVALDLQSFFDAGLSDTAGYLQIYGTSDVVLSNQRDDPYEIRTTATGSEGIAQVTLFSSSDGGESFISSAMERTEDDEYTGFIPGAGEWWTEIRYFLQAVDSTYRVARNPPDAPIEVFDFVTAPAPDFFPPDSVSGVDFALYDLLSWIDEDGDGDLDVFASHNHATFLFRNEGGRTFADVTNESGTGFPQMSRAVAGDYDNDGFDDLLLGGSNRPLTLLHNGGDGTFTDVSSQVGLGEPLWISMVAWCDVDLDGCIDIITSSGSGSSHLFMNRQGAWFFDEAYRRGLDEVGLFQSRTLLFDADGDGDQDLLSTLSPARYFENVGGFFMERTPESGLGESSYFAVPLDVDSDRDMDLLTKVGSMPAMFLNDGSGVFTLEQRDRGLPPDFSQSPVPGDLNNDGTSDLLTPSRYYACFLMDPDGNFLDATGLLEDPYSFLASSSADVDRDGMLDVYGGEGISLSAGIPGGYENYRLEVDLEGRQSNRSGLGASVTLFAGPKVITQQVSGQPPGPARLHFGTERESPDSIIVRWPSGSVQAERELPMNSLVTVIEDSGFVSTGGEAPAGKLPASFALHQNYPNPFNPSTTIVFDIPETGEARHHVSLAVYNVRGRLVKTLIDGELEAGSRRIVWDGKDSRGEQVSSGVYLYTLKCGGSVQTRKMIVLK